MAKREKVGGGNRGRERDGLWVGGWKGGGGNLISIPIKSNLFWRVTETARCHYADLRGWGEEKCLTHTNYADILVRE